MCYIIKSNFGDVPKWLKGPHSKCGRSGNRRVGSNPTISAIIVKNTCRKIGVFWCPYMYFYHALHFLQRTFASLPHFLQRTLVLILHFLQRTLVHPIFFSLYRKNMSFMICISHKNCANLSFHINVKTRCLWQQVFVPIIRITKQGGIFYVRRQYKDT